MRFQAFLLLSLFVGAFALKGGKVRGARADSVRSLVKSTEDPKGTVQSKDDPKGTVKSKEDAKGTVKSKEDAKGTVKSKEDPKGTVNSKEDPKGAKDSPKAKKKESPKTKKAKKCKKAKKAKKAAKLEESDAAPAQTPSDSPPAQAPSAKPEDVPYCLHGKRTPEECHAATKGKVPKDDKSVKGDIELEISYDEGTTPKEVLTKVEEILRKETSAKFIGCVARRLQEDTGNGSEEVISEEEAVSVTGVEFAELVMDKDSNSECSSTGSGLNCDKIETDAEIFYEGKDATSEEKDEMFALLIATIQSQAASGSFEEVGTIETVDSNSDPSKQEESSSGASGGGTSAGLPVGVVVGVLAVVAAICGVFLYKRRKAVQRDANSKDGATSESGDEDGHASDISMEAPIEVEAVLVENNKYSKKKSAKK